MASKPEKSIRCAIYTRKSTEHGLELEFNSLDAQREACEAYIKSPTHEGWRALPQHYDDAGLSGGNLDRPALQQLLDGYRCGSNRRDRGLQDRPIDAIAGRFRKARRSCLTSKESHLWRLRSSSTPPRQWDA